MTAGEFALQVAAIGGQQVATAALRTVSVVVVAAAVLALVYAVRGQLRAYPDRYERPAPLVASAPEGHGCPWCDDRGISSQCDCTADCERWCCMAGSGGALPRGHGDGPALERQIDQMIREYRRG